MNHEEHKGYEQKFSCISRGSWLGNHENPVQGLRDEADIKR